MQYKITKWIGAAAFGGSALVMATPAFAGNFVGDARDDLVITAVGETPGDSQQSGVAFLFRGGNQAVTPIDVIDQKGLDRNEDGDDFGAAAVIGDFDGDGEDDLAIAAPGEGVGNRARAGAVFIYLGSGGGLNPDVVIDQRGLGANERGDRFGAAMAVADFDGDGIDDLVVGAPNEAIGNRGPSGAVYLFLGSPNGLMATQLIDQTDLDRNQTGDLFGAAMTTGDWDGDGMADLAIGAPGKAPGDDPRSGAVFIYHGTQWGLEAEKVIDQRQLGANERGDLFGAALTSGDFNDDGRDDLAVGAPGEAPGADPKSGGVFMFRGTNMGLMPRQFIDQTGLGANESGDDFGWALTSGDWNGDGRDDLAVGAPGEAPGPDPKSGGVFIYHGTRGDLMPHQFVDQLGLGSNEAGDRFGASLATGNYLGNMRDDLAIGAPGESINDNEDAGGVFLYRGGANRLRPIQFVNQTGLGGNEEGDQFGIKIAE